MLFTLDGEREKLLSGHDDNLFQSSLEPHVFHMRRWHALYGPYLLSHQLEVLCAQSGILNYHFIRVVCLLSATRANGHALIVDDCKKIDPFGRSQFLGREVQSVWLVGLYMYICVCMCVRV